MSGRALRIALLGMGALALLSAGGAARAQQSYVVDGQTWVLGEEEAELCARALVECTPLFAKFRAETQRASRKERDSVERIARAHAEKEAAQADLAALREEVAGLEQEIEAMRSSTSWWLTAPLRWLGSFFGSEGG